MTKNRFEFLFLSNNNKKDYRCALGNKNSFQIQQQSSKGKVLLMYLRIEFGF